MSSFIKHLRSFNRLFRRAYAQYGRSITVLVVLGFLGGFLEGVGINALIPILSLFLTGESGGGDVISRWLERVFDFLHLSLSLTPLLVLMAALFVLKSFVTLWFQYIKIKIRADYEQEKRSMLFSATTLARWPHLLKQKSGFLETVLVIDVRNSAELLNTISSSIMGITSLVVYLLVAINISFWFTIITLVVGGLAFFSTRPLVQRARTINKLTTAVNKDIAHFVSEHTLGIKTVKTLVAETPITEIANRLFARLRSYQLKNLLLGVIPTVFVQPLGVVYIVIIIGFIQSHQSEVALASLAALIYLINRIFYYLQSLQSKLTEVSSSAPYLEEVLKYEQRVAAAAELDTGAKEFVLREALTLRDINFSHGATSILSGLNFSVRRGQIVGLIGLSGAGKTTIFDLLLRFFEPDSGSIFVDDVDVRDIGLSSLREKVGYVAQDIFLLNDTVLNNIRFYKQSVGEEQIVVSAQQAGIHDFIMSLPQGYQTIVGERGVKFSVGQRQRIALARVLARRPEVLLLDEITSSLDPESEGKIQETIESLRGKITILIIAHRLSTVSRADQLLVLDQGAIKESGSPASLLQDQGSFFYRWGK